MTRINTANLIRTDLQNRSGFLYSKSEKMWAGSGNEAKYYVVGNFHKEYVFTFFASKMPLINKTFFIQGKQVMFQSSSHPVKACQQACLWWLLLRPSGNQSATGNTKDD